MPRENDNEDTRRFAQNWRHCLCPGSQIERNNPQVFYGFCCDSATRLLLSCKTDAKKFTARRTCHN